MILGESNLEDWIIIDENSTGGRYSVVMNVE